MTGYRELLLTGELKARVQRALSLLENCTLCPRECGANRLLDDTGKCRTGRQALVASYGPHFGEEAPLVGSEGSGTIFFTNCNLKCVFCQNYTISQKGEGVAYGKYELARVLLSLQSWGCHNINLVSPSHVVPQILEAVEAAAGLGLSIPIVYNSGGYDSLETLRLLDGIVDIYMPDMKYSDEMTARRYSGIKGYPAVNRAAVKEMHRQAGDLRVDARGVAARGLLVRHLVLPNGLAGTEETVRFLADEVSRDTYTNIMAQYHPCHRAGRFPLQSRPVSMDEFQAALKMAREAGLRRLDRVRPAVAIRAV
ncbi:MAG: radical SAM protein [Chloroflexi bacterium]|nr:radical SAM protein [Chloroflexota bacterium]